MIMVEKYELTRYIRLMPALAFSKSRGCPFETWAGTLTKSTTERSPTGLPFFGRLGRADPGLLHLQAT